MRLLGIILGWRVGRERFGFFSFGFLSRVVFDFIGCYGE